MHVIPQRPATQIVRNVQRRSTPTERIDDEIFFLRISLEQIPDDVAGRSPFVSRPALVGITVVLAGVVPERGGLETQRGLFLRRAILMWMGSARLHQPAFSRYFNPCAINSDRLTCFFLASASALSAKPRSIVTLYRLAPAPTFGRPTFKPAPMAFPVFARQWLGGNEFSLKRRHLGVALGVTHFHETLVIAFLTLLHRLLRRSRRFSGSVNGRAWITNTTFAGENT